MTDRSEESPPETTPEERNSGEGDEHRSESPADEQRGGGLLDNTTDEKTATSSSSTGRGEGVKLVIEDYFVRYPISLGAILGALALLALYAFVTVVTLVYSDEGDTFEAATEVFFLLADLGSGREIVDRFTEVTTVPHPVDVDPSDYPTWEDQLQGFIDLILATPDVPLLLLYLFIPYLLFTIARFLAKTSSPTDELLQRLMTGLTLLVGTFIIALLIGAIFAVESFAGRVIRVGIGFPLVFAGLGALAAWYYPESVRPKLIGLGAVIVSYLVALLISPGTGDVDLHTAERLVVAVGTVVEASQFEITHPHVGWGVFIAIALVMALAGALLAHVSRRDLDEPLDGARQGASLWLGVLWPVAVLLWLFPMTAVLAVLPTGLEFDIARNVTTASSYIGAIVIGGVLFPAVFGAIGGYIRIWYRDH